MKHITDNLFPAFSKNENGVWLFIPKNKERFNKGKSTKGRGIIKYPEGSIYYGDVFFDGKNYNKLGQGQQDFSSSDMGGVDTFINERMYKFVGTYNYRKNDWIYGNGVLYYKDLNGKPSHFVKGVFHGTNKVSDYVGEFDYSSLLEGYTKELEFDYTPRKTLYNKELKALENVENLDYLFIGDSYFEFWFYKEFTDKLFYDAFFNKNHLNLGLGGTTFEEWWDFIDKLPKEKNVKNIIINLGFNDIHSGKKITELKQDFIKTINMLNKIYPNANYYLLKVVHAPCFPQYLHREYRWNKLLDRLSEEFNVKVLDLNKKLNDKNVNYFANDLVHLNKHGYDCLEELLKETIYD